jgi:hypothetical protein
MSVPSRFVTADRDETSYIRGGGGVSVDPRRFMRAIVLVTLATLAILTTVLVIGVIQKHSQISRLKDHGVVVAVTITSCIGNASGTGITAAGFSCSGSFTLGGINHTDVLKGNSVNQQIGDRVTAITDARDPSDLSTPDAVSAARLPLTDLVAPAVSALLLVIVLALGMNALLRRRAT